MFQSVMIQRFGTLPMFNQIQSLVAIAFWDKMFMFSTNVLIGNNVKIQNNVSVFEGVELEDYVFCGPSMVFTNVKNPRSKYPQNNQKYKKTLVKKSATIGANATVMCGITIGQYSLIGAVQSFLKMCQIMP